MTRSRESVIQSIISLANHVYIFAYKLNQSGGTTIERRPSGIVSLVSVDPRKASAYGNVVAPGALAQDYQHAFDVRLHPALTAVKHDNPRKVDSGP